MSWDFFIFVCFNKVVKMEGIYQTFVGSHNGISYSTIIIFGAFIFLLLLTFLGQGGRVSEVLRKASFFSTISLLMQGVLGVMMEYYSPTFSTWEGSYLVYFRYSICILISAGLMLYVTSLLKNMTKVSLFTVVVALTAALIFEYAYPWSKIFG